MMKFSQRNKIISVAVMLLACLVLGLGLPLAVANLFDFDSAASEEETIRDELAMEFGLESDWVVIDGFVSYQYLYLGLSRAEVHDRLSKIGSFTIKNEDTYLNDNGRAVNYEVVVFDSLILQKELGLRAFEYDSQTGLLSGTLKTLLPSGEGVRLLPPP